MSISPVAKGGFGKRAAARFAAGAAAIAGAIAGAAMESYAAAPVVVVPDAATAVERFAAKELAGELGKCLGETPEIAGEASLANGGGARREAAARLFVGATKAAERARAAADGAGRRPYQVDEVFLKSVPGGVVLDGDPARGPIYAVDLYLERFCGVRWWTSDAATHPKLGAAPVKDVSLSYSPQFKYRETYYLDGFDPLFKVRSKGNFTSITRYLLDEIRFVPPEMGGNHRLYFFKGRHSAYHSFFEILPPKDYFGRHPEWYSLVDGKRVAKQLCLANEEMKAEYVKETLKRLREDPSADFVQVSQNDCQGFCQCDRCKAMMDEDGGVPSGPYLRFANEVAEAVEKEFPNVRIDTFAYQFTRKAPTKTRPRRNVVVRLCDIECDFARPLAEPLPPREAKFAKDLADWRRVAGGNLFIWDYLANFRNYMMPHPNVGSIAPNIRLFAANGAVGVFEQGDAICSAGSFATLRHYLASHLLWDPNDDDRRLVDEFMEGYYGKSAAPILKKLVAVVDAGPRKTRQTVKCGHDGAPFLTGGDKLEAAKLMDEAVAAAEGDGEPFASRARRERLSFDHMMLLNYDALRGASARLGYKWTRPATRAEAVENWIRDVKALGVKARRETTSADEIGKYFGRLRGQAAAPGGVRVSCDYPGGSVVVKGIDETNGVVRLATDLTDTKGRKWMRFDFKVRGAEGRTLRFKFPDDKFNYLATLGPAVSRDGGATWAWLRPDGSRHEPSNAFDWTFGPQEHETRFAFCIPYLQRDWERLVAKYRDRKDVEFGALCKSQGGTRDTDMLRVPCRKGGAKWLVVFTARHHASEASASFAMEGAIEEALSGSDEGGWLRDNADCVFVPFMDKDGVENGEQGKHRHPHDHNRDYAKDLYSSVRALKGLLAKEGAGRQIVFFDLHSPSARSGAKGNKSHDNVFTISPLKPEQKERWRRFRRNWIDLQKDAKLKYAGKFDKAAPEKEYDDAMKKGALNSRQYVGGLSNCWMSVCCEFGYSLCGGVFSEDGGRELGAGMVKAAVRAMRDAAGK